MATRNLSIRLATEGGQRVKRELQEVGDTGDKALDKIRRAAAPASFELKALNTTAGLLKRSFAAAGAALTTYAGVQGVGGVVNVLADFGQKMSEARAVMQASDADFARMTETARRMGATTTFSASQAAEGLTFLGRAGFSTSQAIEALPATLSLAAAAGLDLGLSADITSNIMSAFGIEARRTGEIADVLAVAASNANTDVNQMGEAMAYVGPVARAMNQSLTETAAGVGILSNAGIQASAAGTGLRRILSELANPSAAARDALASMGVEVEELNPKTTSLTEIVKRLKDANIDAGEAFQIFGDRGAPAILALTSMVGDLEKLNGKLEDSAGAAERMAAVMNDNLRGDLKALGSVIEELTLQSGDAGLTGALRGIIQTATEFLQVAAGMEDAVKGNVETYKLLIEVIKAAALGFASLLVARRVGAAFAAMSIAARGLAAGLTTANLATRALAISVTGLRRALLLLGGPAGIAFLAAEGIYLLASSSDEASKSIENQSRVLLKHKDLVDELQTSFGQLTKEQIAAKESQLATLQQELLDTQQQISAAEEKLNTRLAGHARRNFVNRTRSEIKRLEADANQLQTLIKQTTTFIASQQEGLQLTAPESPDLEAERQNLTIRNAIQTLEQQRESILKRNAALLEGEDALIRLKAEEEATAKIQELGATVTAEQAEEIRKLTLANAQLEASGKRATSAREAFADNSGIIQALAEERDALSQTERQRSINQALRRLSSGATAEQRQRVMELAGALYDEKAALEALKQAQEDFAENSQIVASLRTEREELRLNERERFINEAGRRLSSNATAEQRAEVEQLAGALFDERQALTEGQQVFEQTRTAGEKYASELAKLDRLLAEGAINQETYTRAVQQAEQAFEEASGKTRSFGEGARDALSEYAKAAADVGTQAEEAMGKSLKGLEDALVEFATTGKLTFKDLANSILADLTRIAIRQAITGPLAQGLLGASIFHAGGVAGNDNAPLRLVPPSAFAGARRYHSGGIAGLMPDEVPAILQRGEMVIPRETVRQMPSSPMQSAPVINMTVVARDAESFRQSRGQIMADLATTLARHKGRNT